MANSVTTVFQFQQATDVRVIIENGEPLFHANDLCAVLEYVNPRDALRRHVEKDDVVKRDTIDSMGRTQQSNFVLEAGMWALMLGSETPKAKEVKRWVTSEVLPSIRKTGSYTAPVKVEKLTGEQEKRIKHLVWGMASCFGHSESASQSIWNVIRIHFSLKNFTDLPATQFEEAIAMLERLNREIAQPWQQFKHDLELTVIDQYLGQALPWTPYLKRELMRKFKEAIPNQPNWLEVAQRLGVENRQRVIENQ